MKVVLLMLWNVKTTLNCMSFQWFCRKLWMNVNFSPVITSFPQHRKNLYKKKEHSGEKQHLETKNESFNRLKVNFYYFIAESCPWWCSMSCPWCLSSSLRLKGKLFVMDFWFLLDRETNSRPPFIPIDSSHMTRLNHCNLQWGI